MQFAHDRILGGLELWNLYQILPDYISDCIGSGQVDSQFRPELCKHENRDSRHACHLCDLEWPRNRLTPMLDKLVCPSCTRPRSREFDEEKISSTSLPRWDLT
jgi:hypothetical protein